MAKTPITHEQILDAAEDLLRRHGPAKMTVVDVARALGMSHANVYRHVASKAALRDAVAERWLKTISDPLEAIADQEGPADTRLETWLRTLVAAKRRKIANDPELFATYDAIAQDARVVVDGHVATMHRQLVRIVTDGVAQGMFQVADPDAAAWAVLHATIRFHHPHFVQTVPGDRVEAESRAVIHLLIAGLRAGVV